jgi:hypothetical protein
MTAPTIEQTQALPREDQAPAAEEDLGHYVCAVCYDLTNIQFGQLIEAICGYTELFEGWANGMFPNCPKCFHVKCRYCGTEAW